jgi:nicotinamide-nucleotide amidase
VRLELVTIGTELLLGFTVDTNAAWIGRALAEHGISVVRRATVPDDPAAIRDAVRDGLERTGFVLTTGGLGPTQDDITKAAVAALFGRRVVFDDSVWADLVER